jgi:predicted lactoylglutathione lyase
METIGNLIDKLTIVNLRIWMCEDIKRNSDSTDKMISDATRTTNVSNSLRNDLIQEIDERLNHMIKTGEIQKLYKQGSTKMYGK